jgi:hypothetical protein
VLQNYPVMLYLRHICHILYPKWQIRFSISWVTNKPQEKHHWIILKHICHFASQMILNLGPLLQCMQNRVEIIPRIRDFRFRAVFGEGIVWSRNNDSHVQEMKIRNSCCSDGSGSNIFQPFGGCRKQLYIPGLYKQEIPYTKPNRIHIFCFYKLL